MDPGTIARKTIRRRRRWAWSVGLNVFASVVLAIGLAALLNLISARFYWRTDWSATGQQRLSQQTEQLLQKLPGPIDIWVFYRRGADMYPEIEHLLREYQYQSSKIRVEFIDPDRHLARAEQLSRLHDISQSEVVVIHYEGRIRTLTLEDLLAHDDSTLPGTLPPPARFLGEQALSSALFAITAGTMPVVYFVEGHGERRFDNFDPVAGYSEIAQRIRRDHIVLATLRLGERPAIPTDAAAIIIAGPNRRLSRPVQDVIHAYLDRGGRALWLIDSLTQTGLEGLMEQWGVRLGEGVVIDPERTLSGGDLFVTEYGDHPVSAHLRGTSVFHGPRPVQPAGMPSPGMTDQADKPHVTVLASSSPAGWAERDPDLVPRRYDPAMNRVGSVPVAVAVERGPVPGIDVQIRPTRMVVFGDSSFVSNGGLTGGDEDFFMSALNWLLDREVLMDIAPRNVQRIKVSLDRRAIRRLMRWTMGVLPGSVLALGVLVWFKRRR